MHKSRLGCLVIDCRTTDLTDAAAFWGATLGGPVTIDAEGKYAEVAVPDGEVKVLLQAVDHDSRVHLDIETDDIPAEVARLEGLGARRLAAIKGWVVMEAPTGHRFCIVKPQRPDFARNAAVRG
ncbi:MAG: hypothetical protein KDE22_17500 [Rhodobacterales bacterium]|nr:hypothetical protein [Rhodobacterales bacterium]